MAVTRRQLFKLLGAAVIATPFFTVSPAVNIQLKPGYTERVITF